MAVVLIWSVHNQIVVPVLMGGVEMIVLQVVCMFDYNHELDLLTLAHVGDHLFVCMYVTPICCLNWNNVRTKTHSKTLFFVCLLAN